MSKKTTEEIVEEEIVEEASPEEENVEEADPEEADSEDEEIEEADPDEEDVEEEDLEAAESEETDSEEEEIEEADPDAEDVEVEDLDAASEEEVVEEAVPEKANSKKVNCEAVPVKTPKKAGKKPASATKTIKKSVVEEEEIEEGPSPRAEDMVEPSREVRERFPSIYGPVKKRWKFILCGLFFGYFGAHFMYARRWFLFVLMWAGLVVGALTMEPTTAKNLPQEGNSPAAESPKKGNDAIAIPAIGLWFVLWIGGTFFVKKDGDGYRLV